MRDASLGNVFRVVIVRFSMGSGVQVWTGQWFLNGFANRRFKYGTSLIFFEIVQMFLYSNFNRIFFCYTKSYI